IARQQFTWNDKYLGQNTDQVKDIVKTVGEILAEFETQYFKTHKLTEKSKHTFSYYISHLKRLVGLDTVLTQSAIDQKLQELRTEYAIVDLVRIGYSFDTISN
ncbi:MAG: hypothetical protein ACKN9K_30680, partial [Dolichospermum sp.]